MHLAGRVSERSLDIAVVFYLMSHDLDVLLSRVRSEVESIAAVGVPVLTGKVDIANARLRFANGCIANLTASRISRDKVRKIRFFQPATYVSIDYASQKVELWQLKKTASVDAALVPGAPGVSIAGGDVTVANEEPLARELADFVDAVASKRAPMVTGEDGRRALALAQQITDRMTTEARPRPEDMRNEDTNEGTKICKTSTIPLRLAIAALARARSPDRRVRSGIRRPSDRACSIAWRRAGASSSTSPPASTCRSPANVYDRTSACLALGVKHLDDPPKRSTS